MPKRYDDCVRDDCNCDVCALSNYGHDCRNNPTNIVAYWRKQRGLTQAALAKSAGINIRLLQKIEYGEHALSNTTLKTAFALADALSVSVYEFRQ